MQQSSYVQFGGLRHNYLRQSILRVIEARKDNGQFIDVVLGPSHYLYNLPSGSHPWLKDIQYIRSACGGAVYISYEVNVVEYSCGCIVFVLGNSAPPRCPRGHSTYPY